LEKKKKKSNMNLYLIKRRDMKDIFLKLQDILADFINNPIKHGITVSYFIISAGAAIWLVLFSLSFVMKILGL